MWRTAPLRFGLLWLLIVGGAALLVWGLAQDDAGVRMAALVLGAAVAGLAGLALLRWFLRCWSTTLTITEDRIIFCRGLIAKHSSEVRIVDVRNIIVEQSVLQRILHVGSLGISSAGQADVEIAVSGVPHPDDIAELIRSRSRPALTTTE